jgi:hypothetical protein
MATAAAKGNGRKLNVEFLLHRCGGFLELYLEVLPRFAKRVLVHLS